MERESGAGDQPRLSRAEEIQLQKLLSNYKLTPMTLAMKLNPRIIPARHLMYISSIVASAVAKGHGRIIISLPPRHGKTELITKNTPIWTLENFGRKNVILCSYGGDLSSDFGRYTRDLIKENHAHLNLRIRADAERVNNWLTDQGGAMYSVGLGGPITGRGADVLIIDDYIKEIKESMSELHRNYVWDWFVTTSRTRLEPGGTIIIVATRWHHDDLIGRLLKKDAEREREGRQKIWTNIVIPAIAEENDILGRPPGTPLFAERYPLEDLLELKDELGSFFFNALYQQRPENDAGKLTDRNWIKYLSVIPDLSGFKLARIWDLAATDDGGDYMVGSLMAYHPQRDVTILIDVKRAQLGPLKVESLVARTAQEDGPNVQIYIEQEPGSSGKLLVANYAANILKGYPVEGVPASPKNNKVTRAQPFLAAVEAGRVYLIQAPWNKVWADEYDSFPAVEHDDQIDTAGIGYTMLSGKKLLRASWGRKVDAKAPKNIIQTINGDNTSDLIILPNGKTYRMDGSIVPANDDIVVPRRAGVVWGRQSSKHY
jgi:predicted phage terminase large subunit-like protein